jgi:tRNA modification GTPase
VDATDADPVPPPVDLRERFPETWVVLNKCDIIQRDIGNHREPLRDHKCVMISAKTGESFDKLLTMLGEFLVNTFSINESVLITRERHRHLLSSCHQALGRALGETAGREDIIAEELRLAARDLGRLTGRVDVEDVLDVIFRDFCIGK